MALTREDELASRTSWTGLALRFHISEEFERRGPERYAMHFPLLRVSGRLDPKTGLRVELLPLRMHRLTGAATGQHNEPEAIRRWRVPVGLQSVAQGGELGRREKPLVALLVVARDAFAGVALRLIAPRGFFPFLPLERDGEHFRRDRKDPVRPDD